MFTTFYISNLPAEKQREKYTVWLSHSKRRFRPTRRSLPFFSRFCRMTYRLPSLIGYSRCVILPVLTGNSLQEMWKRSTKNNCAFGYIPTHVRKAKGKIGSVERPICPRQRGFVAWETSRRKSRLGFFGITTGRPTATLLGGPADNISRKNG